MKKNRYQHFNDQQNQETGGYQESPPPGKNTSPYIPQHQHPIVYPHTEAPMAPPQYQPQAQQMQPIIIQQAPPPPIMQHQNLNYPSNLMCHSCRVQVVTIVTNQPGPVAFMWCVAIFCVFWPICWIPFVLNPCMDKSHRCPRCGQMIMKKQQGCCEFLGC